VCEAYEGRALESYFSPSYLEMPCAENLGQLLITRRDLGGG
jgi:hypothetical protein